MSRPFAKYEGLGNDFIVLESAAWPANECSPELARRLCDRHRGIGGDGVLWLDRGADGTLRLVILNADGSRPEMCGNGVRCVAVHEHVAGRAALGREIVIETDAGARASAVQQWDDHAGRGIVEVEMGAVRIVRDDVALADGAVAIAVDVGNPHAVVFGEVSHGREMDLVRAAEARRDVWPRGVNVEFAARAMDDSGATVRVHERGVGWTQACGTGACAVAAAMLAVRGESRGSRWIDLDGGRLEIALETRSDGLTHARMRGPARRVFAGTIG
jgi:diaminopimelate epimerase